MTARLASLRERVTLAPMTTFQVGGEARWFLDAHTDQELTEALAWARKSGVAAVILGGGSNVLVSDRGFDGLVIRIRGRGLRVDKQTPDEAVVHVAAGEDLDSFVHEVVQRGYAGVECLSGIPGSVGATPVQNVGAYGQEVCDTIREVRVIDRATGEVCSFSRQACTFAYRSSVFKEALADRYVVTSVTFVLRPDGRPRLRYPELERAVGERVDGAPTVAHVREVVLGLRRAKSMLIDATDPNHRSAGSFFVNPIVSSEAAERVAAAAATRGAQPERAMPRFPSAAGVKLSAGWLIEQAGFSKGMPEGPVGLSSRHALCVVNRGGASAQQIVEFAGRVRAEVRERLGVTLTPEPVRLGFTCDEEAPLCD